MWSQWTPLHVAANRYQRLDQMDDYEFQMSKKIIDTERQMVKDEQNPLWKVKALKKGLGEVSSEEMQPDFKQTVEKMKELKELELDENRRNRIHWESIKPLMVIISLLEEDKNNKDDYFEFKDNHGLDQKLTEVFDKCWQCSIMAYSNHDGRPIKVFLDLVTEKLADFGAMFLVFTANMDGKDEIKFRGENLNLETDIVKRFKDNEKAVLLLDVSNQRFALEGMHDCNEVNFELKY